LKEGRLKEGRLKEGRLKEERLKYEIERKFLVKIDKWGVLVRPEGHLYVQGYLNTDPEKTIRVRIADSKGYITLKGIMVGAKRLEYEYEIPAGEAKEILDNFTENHVAKIRYKFNFKGKDWVVDEFIDNNFGLIVAEIELNSEDEKFELPDWAGKEVTDDARYFNSNLSVMPFNKW
jgi:CYTH domain-containing protein